MRAVLPGTRARGLLLSAAITLGAATSGFAFDLSIEVNNPAPEVNDYITVTFQATGCPPFLTAAVYLEFENSYLNVESQQAGSLNAAPDNQFAPDGDVGDGDVACSSGRIALPVDNNPGGDGSLAVITFRVGLAGSTTITTYNYPGRASGNVVRDLVPNDFMPNLIESQITLNISAYTPVAVSSASARSVGVGALVEWTAQSEIDNVGFDVLRRPARPEAGPGGEWLTVTPRPVPGRLTAVGPKTYRWLDLYTNVDPGRYEYRVESISATGAREPTFPRLQCGVGRSPAYRPRNVGTPDTMTVTVRPGDLAASFAALASGSALRRTEGAEGGSPLALVPGLLWERASGSLDEMRAVGATALRRRQLARLLKISPRRHGGHGCQAAGLQRAGSEKRTVGVRDLERRASVVKTVTANVKLLASTAEGSFAAARGAPARRGAPVQRPSAGDVRVRTRGDGVFFVPAASLPVDPSRGAPPRRVALLRDGVRLRPLRADASGIWFFAPDHSDSYTDLNATFVTASPGVVPWSGVGCGRLPAPGPAPLASETCVRATARAEEDAMYVLGARGSPDPWLYAYYLSDRSPEQTVTLDVSDLAPGGTTLRLGVYGYTSDDRVDPDHELVVSVNGEAQAHLTWDGRGYRVFDVALPEGAVREGVNSVSLLAPRSAAIPRGHMVILDYVEVEYRSLISLERGPVAFEVDAPCVVEVGDLAQGSVSRDVWVIEVDGAGRARRIAARVVASQRGGGAPGAGAGRVARFNARPGLVYYVAASEHVRVPEEVSPANVIDLPAGTDYLAVGPDALRETTLPLLALRRAGGLSAEYVSLARAIDTCGGGRYGASAVVNLVRRVRPRYVLLVGDNSYDYLDRTGEGVDPMVPSVLVSTAKLCETNADALFGDLDGDGVPDVPVGRLPVRTEDGLRNLVGKITGHGLTGSFPTGVLVADDADEKGDFPAAQRRVARAFPDVIWTELYLGVHGESAFIRRSLTEAVDAGADVVVYQGHGSRSWLASRPGSGPAVLDTDEAALWTSSPAVYLSTCWSALIQNATEEADSIAEVLLRGPAGAVAVMGSTTACTQSSQEALLRDFLDEALGHNGGRTIGDAMVAAQRRAASRAASAAEEESSQAVLDTVRCYSVLGDPAMPLVEMPPVETPPVGTR